MSYFNIIVLIDNSVALCLVSDCKVEVAGSKPAGVKCLYDEYDVCPSGLVFKLFKYVFMQSFISM